MSWFKKTKKDDKGRELVSNQLQDGVHLNLVVHHQLGGISLSTHTSYESMHEYLSTIKERVFSYTVSASLGPPQVNRLKEEVTNESE